jgi:hypothetical protein
MKASSKRQEEDLWKAHSTAWKAGGMTRQAYCGQEGISYRRFIYQHNRLMRRSKKGPLKFIEAKAESATIGVPTSSLQLMLPNGIRSGISAEINPELLQTVLNVAGAVRCLS